MTGTVATSHFFTTKAGTKTHYLQYGNATGPLVILLHGLGGSTGTFTALLPHLPSGKYKIISVDFEGFGKTPLSSPDTQLSVNRHVADLDNLIAFLQGSGSTDAGKASNKEPVSIIGHSLGSIVALHYAAKNPDSVAGLGLLGVGRSASHIEAARQRMLDLAKTVREDGIEAAAQLATVTNFPPGEEAPASHREEVRNAVAASDPEGYARTCEAMVSPDHVDPDYAQIKCPAVFVAGAGDSISPPERSNDVSRLLKGTSVVRVVQGGHQPIISDLESTKKAVLELFALVEV